jgi:hypothetical protein
MNEPFINVQHTHTFTKSVPVAYGVTFKVCRALWIGDGASGDLAVVYQDGTTDTLPDVMPGVLPGQIVTVVEAGSEIAAARIRALY